MNLKFFLNWANPVVLITTGWSNPLLKTPLRNLGTTSLLYYKYCIFVDSTKKERKKREIERKDTHAIKRNKRYRANKYHEMTPFIVFKCNKERSHKRRSVTRANTDKYIFLEFPIDI